MTTATISLKDEYCYHKPDIMKAIQDLALMSFIISYYERLS